MKGAGRRVAVGVTCLTVDVALAPPREYWHVTVTKRQQLRVGSLHYATHTYTHTKETGHELHLPRAVCHKLRLRDTSAANHSAPDIATPSEPALANNNYE